MSESEGQRLSFKDVLNGVPAFIAGFVSLIFIATAIREWGYYHVIGVDFILINSPAEYTSVALYWIPNLALVWGLWLVIELFDRREIFSQKDKDSSTSFRIGCQRIFLFLGNVVACISVPIVLLVHLYFRREFEVLTLWMFFAILMSWTLICIWLLRYIVAKDIFKRTIIRSFILLPIVMGYAFLDGYYEAYNISNMGCGKYIITKNDDKLMSNVHLLRTTYNGMLILQLSNKEISFWTYNSFKSMKRIDKCVNHKTDNLSSSRRRPA